MTGLSSHMVDRHEFDVPASVIQDRDHIPVMISPITYETLRDVTSTLTDQLISRYRDQSVEVPLHYSLLSDQERGEVSITIDAILDDQWLEPHHVALPAEEWLEREMMEDPISLLPDQCWIRVLEFPRGFDLIKGLSINTSLSSLDGAVPFALPLSSEVTELLHIDVEDPSLELSVLFVQPVFSRVV